MALQVYLSTHQNYYYWYKEAGEFADVEKNKSADEDTQTAVPFGAAVQLRPRRRATCENQQSTAVFEEVLSPLTIHVEHFHPVNLGTKQEIYQV